MENTKQFITYNVVLNSELAIHTSDSQHKSYTEAKKAISDKLNQIANNPDMRQDNKEYWSNKYLNAVIVEQVSTYTVIE